MLLVLKVMVVDLSDCQLEVQRHLGTPVSSSG
jgi:hypothetical protein